MEDNVITTAIDKLLELVEKKGSISIKDAAKVFNVSRSQIESWVKILEEHELIEVHYPPIGEPELRKKELEKPGKKKKVKKE